MSRDSDVRSALRTSIIRAVRTATGLHERIAREAADAIFIELSREIGGDRIWWPKADDMQDRDTAIVQEFRDGVPWRTICERHGISKSRLYQIVGR